MNGNVPPIGTVQLLTTIVLVFAAGAVSALLRLGLLRSLAWGTVRTVVQLLLIGHALLFVFSMDNIWLVLATVASPPKRTMLPVAGSNAMAWLSRAGGGSATATGVHAVPSHSQVSPRLSPNRLRPPKSTVVPRDAS